MIKEEIDFVLIIGVQHPLDNKYNKRIAFDDYVMFNKSIYYHVVTNTHIIATKKAYVSISFICSA